MNFNFLKIGRSAVTFLPRGTKVLREFSFANWQIKDNIFFFIEYMHGKTFVNNSTACILHLKPARHSITNTKRKNFVPQGNSNKRCSGIKADIPNQ